ncbi:MAG TPA: hypothetical protein VNT25_02885 [Allosphingosinicella sp.]|nr:hypothetical protein [Allosphingosinicella sp.]
MPVVAAGIDMGVMIVATAEAEQTRQAEKSQKPPVKPVTFFAGGAMLFFGAPARLVLKLLGGLLQFLRLFRNLVGGRGHFVLSRGRCGDSKQGCSQ